MKTILVILLITISVWGDEPQTSAPPEFFKRIAALSIPEINVTSCTINELIEHLTLRIHELDPKNPNKLSIMKAGFLPDIVVVKLQDGSIVTRESGPPGYDYKAKDVRVDEILNATSRIYNVEYHVTDIGLVVTPVGKNPFPNSQADRGKIYYTYRQTKKPNKSEMATPTKPSN